MIDAVQSPSNTGNTTIHTLAERIAGGSHRQTHGAPAAGYASSFYAAALSDFGDPLALPGSGGWLLKRKVLLADAHDAMGCYPLFACRNWTLLNDDLAALEDELVSVTLVTDPFGGWSEDSLRRYFPDLCVKFKDHYVVDLARISLQRISSHHRRNVRRGLRALETEFCENPAARLDDWRRLYGELIRRHDITGIAAFSDGSLRDQLSVPGLYMQRAIHEGETVGMILWYLSDGIVYYHLGAYCERGYALRASYALFWTALEYFRDRAEWAALGAAAGIRPGDGGGLDRFKAGWATGTRPAFLCGRILAHRRYAELTAARSVNPGNYFPAYRAGEFR